MDPYLFYGRVLPERAAVSIQDQFEFTHVATGIKGKISTNILLNQVVVWVETEEIWDVFDLRNVVKNVLSTQLGILGFLKGYAYEVEITRVLNRGREIDQVFGIDIPCIADRHSETTFAETLQKLRLLCQGQQGIYIHRCLNDLRSAMQHADDTGFYCYRAIESLRHHCAAVRGASELGKAEQWALFRNASGSAEITLREIKVAADPLRHGAVTQVSNEERAELFKKTFSVVDEYVKNA